MTPQQRADLSDLLNFDLVSECRLQRALDHGVSTSDVIAVSALRLLKSVRSELVSIKYISETQVSDRDIYARFIRDD